MIVRKPVWRTSLSRPQALNIDLPVNPNVLILFRGLQICFLDLAASVQKYKNHLAFIGDR